MPTPRKNQKQIAQRYTGNFRYFKQLHPLRRARLLLVTGCLLASIVAGLIYLKTMRSSGRIESFNSPGAISTAHSRFAHDCKQCHDPNVKLDVLKPVVATVLDANCEKCHVQHTFHQPDVVVFHSCTTCHQEHLGAGPMQPVKNGNCLSCHGNATIMADSAKKGLTLPASAFLMKPKDASLVSFQPPRPAMGYTEVFQSFEKDHPAFQIQRENLTDPNTLKFNHKIHLSGDIPMVDGRKLDCAYCHQPDDHGGYMQPIRFAKNCQACHSLQIDPTLPDFQIPHPTDKRTDSARDFILTLPTQYATYATQKMGLTDSASIASFVNQHMTSMRQRIRGGGDFINDVFYANARNVHFDGGAPSTPRERALFPGCAYCHEVTRSAANQPIVTPPVTTDRWYVHARFSHAAHATMNCNACHGQVFQSVKTSDISLPDKASCVTCHSAKGGVVSTCATCHSYHNQAASPDMANASSLRK